MQLQDSKATINFKEHLSHKASKVINRGTNRALKYGQSQGGELGITDVDLEAMEEVYEEVFPLVVESVKDKGGKEVTDYKAFFEDLSQYDFNQIVIHIDDMNDRAQELIKKRRANRKQS